MKRNNFQPPSWGFLLALLVLILLPNAAKAENPMRIELEIGGKTLTATLEDSPTGRDFWSMLPLTLKVKDYSQMEKISDLPRRLSTQGAPEGFKPVAGDFALFVPWGNLAMYYRDGSWYPGLVKIGRLDAGVEELAAVANGTPVTFTKRQ